MEITKENRQKLMIKWAFVLAQYLAGHVVYGKRLQNLSHQIGRTPKMYISKALFLGLRYSYFPEISFKIQIFKEKVMCIHLGN